MSERFVGTVLWFNATKGFGFIHRDDGEHILVHSSSLLRDSTTDAPPALITDQRVEFSVEKGPKGLQAANVVIIR